MPVARRSSRRHEVATMARNGAFARRRSVIARVRFAARHGRNHNGEQRYQRGSHAGTVALDGSAASAPLRDVLRQSVALRASRPTPSLPAGVKQTLR